jgi:peptidoglycan/LPS O-acetylase OafA/YrhL
LDAVSGSIGGASRVQSDGHREAYRADIDGLRAIAVVSVILFHAGVAVVGGGFVGVDIFFVISGYLIGGIVGRDVIAGRFSFAAFYARRARRILPALIALSAAIALLGLFVLGPDELSRLAGSIAAALSGGANVWFWATANYFSPDSRHLPFLMTWSLGIEEQFYLVLPPLLLVAHRAGGQRAMTAIVAALTLASAILSITLTARFPVPSFYLLPTRGWELGVGVLLAFAGSARPPLPQPWQQRSAALGLAAVLGAIVMLDERAAIPGVAVAVPVIGTAMIIAAPDSWINRRLLAARPLVAIGLISYSWYLWHWPLMAFVRIVTAGPPVPAVMLSVAIVSIVPAWASWRYVERPFRRPMGRSNAAVLIRYAAVAGTMAAAMGALWYSGGLPARLGPRGAVIAQMIDAQRHERCLAGDGTATLPSGAPCVDRRGGNGLALLGDSHAAALAPAARDVARSSGIDFVQYTKSSCPPLLGATRRLPTTPGEAATCATFAEQAIRRVAADPAIGTVIITGFWEAPFDVRALKLGERYIVTDPQGAGVSNRGALAQGLGRAIAALTSTGKRVIVLGDVPYLQFDPVGAVYADRLPARAALQHALSPDFAVGHGSVARRWATAEFTNADPVLATTAARYGARYVALADILCTPARCRFASDGLPLYIDPQHLSRVGARQVIDALAARGMLATPARR